MGFWNGVKNFFGKVGKGILGFAKGVSRVIPSVVNAVSGAMAAGGPKAALAAGLATGIPGIIGDGIPSAIAAVNGDPSGGDVMTNLRALGDNAINGAAAVMNTGWAQDKMSRMGGAIDRKFGTGDAFGANLGGAGSALAGALQGMAGGKTFRQAVTESGVIPGHGRAMAEGAMRALNNKVSGMVGVHPEHTAMVGNSFARSIAAMTPKSSMLRDVMDGVGIRQGAALSGHVMRSTFGTQVAPGPPTQSNVEQSAAPSRGARGNSGGALAKRSMSKSASGQGAPKRPNTGARSSSRPAARGGARPTQESIPAGGMPHLMRTAVV